MALERKKGREANNPSEASLASQEPPEVAPGWQG